MIFSFFSVSASPPFFFSPSLSLYCHALCSLSPRCLSSFSSWYVSLCSLVILLFYYDAGEVHNADLLPLLIQRLYPLMVHPPVVIGTSCYGSSPRSLVLKFCYRRVQNTSNSITWTYSSGDPSPVSIIILNSDPTVLNGAFSIDEYVDLSLQVIQDPGHLLCCI
jgi:hypothetical protein